MNVKKKRYEPAKVGVLQCGPCVLMAVSGKPHRPGHGWGDGNHEHDKREEEC